MTLFAYLIRKDRCRKKHEEVNSDLKKRKKTVTQNRGSPSRKKETIPTEEMLTFLL